MARGTYTVSGAGITVANAAVTLVFINPAATQGIEILRCWISQVGMSSTGQQRVQLSTQVTAFPTLTSATPAAHSLGMTSAITGGTAGAAGTSGINASAEGAGAKSVILSDAYTFNGYLWVSTPEERITLSANSSSGFGLHLPVAPAVLTGFCFGVTFRELG